MTGLRRTAWTFGAKTYSISDGRALDAWTEQRVLVLRPLDDPGAVGNWEVSMPRSERHSAGHREQRPSPDRRLGAMPETVDLSQKVAVE